jgi:hypothetical protein
VRDAGCDTHAAMGSRSLQILAAVVSLAVMVVVIVQYGMSEDEGAAASHPEDSRPHGGGVVLPIQPFATAKIGDWKAYNTVTESSVAPTVTATAIERMTKVDDKTVSRELVGKVEQTSDVRHVVYEDRPRHGLTLDQLTTNDGGEWTIYNVSIVDDAHVVGGRTFKCKRISYDSTDPMIATKRTHTDLWISDEIPVDGVVEEIEVQEMPSMHFRMTKQTVGFGTATTTTWGTKPQIE